MPADRRACASVDAVDQPRRRPAPRRCPAGWSILGGGVVGCEMATAWQALGTQVTLLVRGAGCSPGWSRSPARLVAAALRDARRRRPARHRGRAADRTGRRRTSWSTTSATATVARRRVLVATGRRPRTADLGLETVGLEPGDCLDVDDTLRVPRACRWLYAVGDVNHRALLTHKGKYQARAGRRGDRRPRAEGEVSLADWAPFVATADHVAAPQVVFTDPEVATVGLHRRRGGAGRAAASASSTTRSATSPAPALYADGYRGRRRWSSTRTARSCSASPSSAPASAS